MTGTNRKGGRRRGLMVQERDLLLLSQLWIMHVADREQLMVAAGFTSITRINTRLLALCFWQLALAQFGGLMWPTLGTLSLRG